MTSLRDISITTLDGNTTTLGSLASGAALIVNVASQCGLTPQYQGLEELAQKYPAVTVIGVPCNQFAGQEPGTPQEIIEFCTTHYGVTFPLLEKTDVNGPHRHPLYQQLVTFPDAQGEAGDVLWNFEKFFISAAGEVIARFRPDIVPLDEKIIAVIEGESK